MSFALRIEEHFVFKKISGIFPSLKGGGYLTSECHYINQAFRFNHHFQLISKTNFLQYFIISISLQRNQRFYQTMKMYK